jgi:hypothetical protein
MGQVGMTPLEIVGAALEVLQRQGAIRHSDLPSGTTTHAQFTISRRGDTMANVLQSVTVDSADEFGIVSAGTIPHHTREGRVPSQVRRRSRDPAAILRNMLDKCKTAVSCAATTSAGRRMDPKMCHFQM